MNTSDKYCGGCRQKHPRDAFASNIMTSDGLQDWCREAMRQYRQRKKAAKARQQQPIGETV
jgi:hypothetical protein